jgi:hypothetical protein
MNERTTHIYQKQRLIAPQTHLWLIIRQLVATALAFMEKSTALSSLKTVAVRFE